MNEKLEKYNKNNSMGLFIQSKEAEAAPQYPTTKFF
jgi:hypothetical protein